MKTDVVLNSEGSESRMPQADAVAHFIVDTPHGQVLVLVGIKGPSAQEKVQAIVDFTSCWTL